MTTTKRTLGPIRYLAPLALLAIGAALPEWRGTAQPPPPPPGLGVPLPGLTTQQLAEFEAGRLQFGRVERPIDGLGPVFNGVSCLECHRAGAPGGSAIDLQLTRVTRIGRVESGVFSELPQRGGPLIQRRSLREIFPNHPVFPEVIPPEATVVARRITTPLFGTGLIEAIPDIVITMNADPTDRNGDGISGRPNYITNPETNRLELGRFGWKSQLSTLHHFTGLALIDEMGITNPSFPLEVLPQGLPIPAGGDNVADPEDNGTRVAALTSFQRFLAPPPQGLQNRQGRDVFANIGCAKCHIPTLKTAAHAIAALANQSVNLYSDLLLHDMGLNLADGNPQGLASASEFRTAPLWGVRFRPFLLHDGRATNLDAAIRLHGGEALGARTRYETLAPGQRDALLGFLRGL
ncbi:MAG TPA: di-heme oxidoredictase family protein [Fimbriimonadaceae bacterium]|nr:di-heme oxidoredictase family protein [Fimbriimonadaceae bacterium]HRJ97811.1 di-heme oxidoredictase family protein [Fimbriimonadaceae bacterium]